MTHFDATQELHFILCKISRLVKLFVSIHASSYICHNELLSYQNGNEKSSFVQLSGPEYETDNLIISRRSRTMGEPPGRVSDVPIPAPASSCRGRGGRGLCNGVAAAAAASQHATLVPRFKILLSYAIFFRADRPDRKDISPMMEKESGISSRGYNCDAHLSCAAPLASRSTT